MSSPRLLRGAACSTCGDAERGVVVEFDVEIATPPYGGARAVGVHHLCEACLRYALRLLAVSR